MTRYKHTWCSTANIPAGTEMISKENLSRCKSAEGRTTAVPTTQIVEMYSFLPENQDIQGLNYDYAKGPQTGASRQ